MKIVEDYPPNFEAIKKVFPDMSKNPVFCYGDTIYNPFKVKITPDIEVHEEVHSKQQGFNIDGWWEDYLNDKDFRLKQEIMAYGAQYFFVSKSDMPRKILSRYLDGLAEQLSSSLYGSLVSHNEAKSKIRNASRKYNDIASSK